MACHLRRDRAPYGFPEQIEISENVQNFMPRQFVAEAQICVDDSFIIDQDAVVELAAADKSHLLQLLYVAEKTERSCRSNFRFKMFRSLENVSILLSADRLGIFQNIADREIIRGLDRNEFPSGRAGAIRSLDDNLGP